MTWSLQRGMVLAGGSSRELMVPKAPSSSSSSYTAHCGQHVQVLERNSWRADRTQLLLTERIVRRKSRGHRIACTVFGSVVRAGSSSSEVLQSCGSGQGNWNSVGGRGGGNGLVHTRNEDQNVRSRRAALYLLSSISLPLFGCDAASAAFSPGFSGLKDWLKGQKQKTASFLLAPISASRDRLSSALLIISSDDITSSSYEEAENLVKVAARDCMPLDRGSVLDFQSRSGIEVCTFKLVLKNAASLLENYDPTKLKAEESLKDLIRSFVTLDQILGSGATGGSPDRKNLMGALAQTSGALDRFEGGIRACLGIA